MDPWIVLAWLVMANMSPEAVVGTIGKPWPTQQACMSYVRALHQRVVVSHGAAPAAERPKFGIACVHKSNVVGDLPPLNPAKM